MGKKIEANKGLDQRSAALEERLIASAQQALPAVVSAVTEQLSKLGAASTKVEVSARPKNSIESEFTVRVQTTVNAGFLDYEMVVPMKDGHAALSEAIIASTFKEAVDKFDADDTLPSGQTLQLLDVDLGKVVAHRYEDIVVYSSEDLPTWLYEVPVASLKNPQNHQLIASRILSSLRGICLTDYYRVAAFKQESFSLPAAQATDIKAAAVEPVNPDYQTEYTAEELEAAVEQHNHKVLVMHAAAADSPEANREERDYAFQAELRASLAPVVEGYVKEELKGGNPRIIGFKYDKVRRKMNGLTAGFVAVEVTYYSDQSIEATELKVPYTEDGKIDAEKIGKTELSIKAEAEREAELKILSEEQAKKEMDVYRKELEAKAEELQRIGIKGATSQGANFLQKDAVDRVPVLKALMPADTKPGDKIDLRGYVYEVAATDYNSPDVEHCAFWLLCLTDELPGKAPGLGLWSSMTATAGR